MRARSKFAKSLWLALWFLAVPSVVWAGGGSSSTATNAAPDTAVFWAYNFSFFSGYYNTVAGDTLPNQFIRVGESEHAYIYAENAVWGTKVDTSVVVRVIEAFEKKTPPAVRTEPSGLLADTSGIYQKLTSIFGPPPDVDNDPKIYIVLMNVRDNTGTGSPGASYQGYFDPRNEDPLDPHSNGHEMIYIDVDPTNPKTDAILRSVAAQFQHLLNWRHDPNKVLKPAGRGWFDDGLASLAEFLCGYGGRSGTWEPEIPLDVFPVVTGIDGPTYERVVNQKAMWVLYVFERFGIDVLKAQLADTTTTGVDGLTKALSKLGYTERAEDVFTDWVLAFFLDIVDPTFYDGKYGYKYIDVKATTVGARLWGFRGASNQPYRYTGNNWNALFAVDPRSAVSGIAGVTSLDTTFVIRGDLDHNYRLVEIRSKKAFGVRPDKTAEVIVHAQPDNVNRTFVPIDGLKSGAFLSVFQIIVEMAPDSGVTAAPVFVVTDDVIPPETPQVGLIQNPVYDSFLDIYVFSNEPFYTVDVAEENVILRVEAPDSVYTLGFEPFARSSLDAAVAYHSEFTLRKSGEYTVSAYGRDIGGNLSPTGQAHFSVRRVSPQHAAKVSDPDSIVTLTIPVGAFGRDTYVTLFRVASKPGGELLPDEVGVPLPDSSIPVGEAYRLGPSRMLNKPITLTVKYDEVELKRLGIREEELGIYRLTEKGWEALGGRIDPEGNQISVDVNRLGEFRILKGEPSADTPALPKTYSLAQNYPNPFNAETVIAYELPQDGHVTLKIYNLLGQEVRTLVDERKPAGIHQVTWDGRDEARQALSSGVYFYEMVVAGQFKDIKKLVLLK